MDIIIKLKDAIEIFPALNILAQSKLPANESYRIGKFIRKLSGEVADYEAARGGLLKGLGEQRAEVNKDGTPKLDREANRVMSDIYDIKPEYLDEWNAAIKTMLDEEVTLSGVAMISIDRLDKFGLEIEPFVMAALDLLIEDDA